MAGIDNNVLYGTNVDFTGSFPVSGQINLNGELLVGATVAPFIRAYVPTGSNGLVVNTGQGTLDFTLANIPNGALQNSTFVVSAGTGLSGGGAASLGGSVSLSLATPVSLANGGTNANLTASNGGIFWSNATQGQILSGTATAGQILRSGATATPSWSTATYPATAGTSGNVLTSDGTNWTSSGATGPGGLTLTTAITLTSAQIKALHGTPIQVVAAPGLGKVIVPINGFCKFTYGGTNVFVAGASQYITLALGTTINKMFFDNLSEGFLTNALLVGTTSSYQMAVFNAGVTNGALAAYENIAVNAYNPVATEITGNAANDNTLHIAFMYYVVTL